MNVQKFHEWLQLNKNSKATINKYFQLIDHFGKEYNYKFNQKNFNDYLIKIKEEKSGNTYNLFLVASRAYCNFANLDIEIPKPKKIKRKGIKFYLTEEKLKEILKEYYDLDDLLLRFMFYTGVRPSELLNLEINHIDFKKRDIIIYGAKGDKDRVIPFLNDKLFNDIKSFCNDREGKVFSVTYTQINYLLKRVKKTLQLNDSEIVEPRTMRISFAKYCISIGMDILLLKSLMGHTDIKITELYAEPDYKMIKEFCEKIRKRE